MNAFQKRTFIFLLIMSGSSNAMKFVSPEMYAESQESHFAINSHVVNLFVETFGPLGEKDRVLDFGSGTGYGS